VIDPRGNAVTLNYDGQLRLTSIADAGGRTIALANGYTRAGISEIR
jgi:YD repeat-containing protein